MPVDVETLRVSFEANTSRFDRSVAELNRELRAVDLAADRAKRGLADNLGEGFARAGANSRRFSQQMTNIGFQVQDFIVQVGSGTSALRAFAQQAPQALIGFGPGGVLIGTVAALVGGLASSFLSASDAAEDAEISVSGLVTRLKELGATQSDVQKVVDALNELSEDARALGRERLELGLDQAIVQLREANTGLDDMADRVERVARSRLERTVGGDEPAAGLVTAIENYRRAVEGLEDADPARAAALANFVDELEAVEEAGRRGLGVTRSGLLDAAENAQAAARQVETLNTALRQQPEAFGPPAPGTPEAAVLEEMARGREMRTQAEADRVGLMEDARRRAREEARVRAEEEARAAEFARLGPEGLRGIRPEPRPEAFGPPEATAVDQEIARGQEMRQQAIADQERLNQQMRELGRISDVAMNSLSRGLADAALGASSLSEALQGIVQSIARVGLETFIRIGLQAGINYLAPEVGAASSVVGVTNVHGRGGQFGGPLYPGMASLVHRDEIIVPDVRGEVISAFDQRQAARSAETMPSAGGNRVNIYADRVDPGSVAAIMNMVPAAVVEHFARNPAARQGAVNTRWGA